MPYINRKTSKKSVPYKRLRFDSKNCNKYYNAYRDKRNLYIANNPLDELDLLEGKTTPAEHCHHIIEFLKGRSEEEKMKLCLDEDNLIALSSTNHYMIHNNFYKLTSRQQEYLKKRISELRIRYLL